MAHFHSNALIGAGGQGGEAQFQIDRSLRFNNGDSPSLSKSFGSAGNRKKWTFSCWFKLGLFSQPGRFFSAGTSSTERTNIFYHSSNSESGIAFYSYVGSVKAQGNTTAKLRDPSAWYHLVFQFDCANSTNSDRVKIYINGVEHAVTFHVHPANIDHYIGGNVAHYVGRGADGYSFDGYLAESHYVNGQLLSPSNFGELNDDNVWVPKEFDGSYGTNGFYLKFADNSSNSALGTDSSGSSNTFTVNNLSVASGAGNDSLLDTPMNYTAASGNNGGNYCTWNPLSTNSAPTFSEGNLTVTNTGSGASGWRNIASTIAVSSGKWYMEFDTVGSQNGGLMIGIQKVPEDNDQFNPASFSNNFVGMTNNSYALNCFSGAKRTNSSDASYGSGMSANDKIMMAVDLDNGKIWWGKNNSWFASGDPDSGTNAAFTGLSGTFVFALGISASEKIHSNFGQRPYAYSNNISGFKSVCTQNLADPTIADGSTAMDIVTYTGNASTGTSITGLNHSPDLLWIKSRTTSQWHYLVDTVRGVTKNVASNDTYPEETRTNRLLSFDSNGFTIGNNNTVNENNQSFVAWSWKSGTSTANNTAGTITTSVRVSTTNGFSIATYTGNGNANQTLGHGLNAAPSFVLIKDRTSSQNWAVLHTYAGTLGTLDGGTNYKLLELNSTAAARDASYNTIWYPTSTTVKIGEGANSAHWTNKSGDDYVMFSWAPIDQFSSFGKYTGNGNADGPFVFTGMRPKWLLIKRTDSSKAWQLMDTTRDPINPADTSLFPSDNGGESGNNANYYIDILSNGFKIRTSHDSRNASGGTYVYAAFAEHPFKTARAR